MVSHINQQSSALMVELLQALAHALSAPSPSTIRATGIPTISSGSRASRTMRAPSVEAMDALKIDRAFALGEAVGAAVSIALGGGWPRPHRQGRAGEHALFQRRRHRDQGHCRHRQGAAAATPPASRRRAPSTSCSRTIPSMRRCSRRKTGWTASTPRSSRSAATAGKPCRRWRSSIRWPAWKRCTCPTLMLYGEHFIYGRHRALLQARCPHAQHRNRCPNGRFCMTWERADRRRRTRPCFPRLIASTDEAGALPRLGLAHLPTPLEPMTRLSRASGWPKTLGEARGLHRCRSRRQQAAQARLCPERSTSPRAPTRWSRAAWCNPTASARSPPRRRKLGLDCHLAVYHGRLAPPSADYEKTGNALLNRLFGATLHDVPWNGDRNGAIRDLADRLRAEGRKPYLVPYGVSNPLGAVAYASTVTGDRGPRRRRWVSRRIRSSIAPAAPPRRPDWSSARAPACPRRASSASTSTPSPSACAPTCWPMAKARPTCSISRSCLRRMSRSWRAMPGRPMACRTRRRSTR